MYLYICALCDWSIVSDQNMAMLCVNCGKLCASYDHPESLHILHADMDAFFAAVEILDNPKLKGKPVIVGGDPKSRGVVNTCSYEARKFGVRSAMPLYKAYQLCPQAVFLEPNFKRYQDVSQKIFQIFESFTPLYEPLSIDEAFLDLKGTEHLFGHPILAASKIKNHIKIETGLTVSVGIAPNKFLSKLASGARKPDGLVIVTIDQAQNFLDELDIEQMWGIGQKTLPHLKANGFLKIKDIRLADEGRLRKFFGNSAEHFRSLSLGLDARTVITDSESKSCGKELTFDQDLHDKKAMLKELWILCEKLMRELNHSKMWGRSVHLKVKTSNFQLITRSVTLQDTITTDVDLFHNVKSLLNKIDRASLKVRLLGVSVSRFEPDKMQISLMPEEIQKGKIQQVVDQVKDKYGEQSIARGISKKY